jgi:large subunit ribosomal protein L7/L12
MAEKKNKDAVIDLISTMTVLELSELVKDLEDKFGVSSAPMFAAAPAAGAGAPAEAEEQEEKTEFDVVLTGFGDKKIQVIKVVRAVTTLGLKEAKDLVDNVPKPLKEQVPKTEADDIKAKIEEAGGTVEIK